VAAGGVQALPLKQLVVFHHAPQRHQYTCYFYNRREADGLRYVAYQYADENSVLIQPPDVAELLAATEPSDAQPGGGIHS
jgi:hypothetical protein